MRRCAFDIETDREGRALLGAGWAAFADDTAEPVTGTCQAQQIGDLIGQIAHANLLIGHNIIDFDIPFLEQRFPTMRLAVWHKRIIDTLYLSPVAFPRNPYHHLYKSYKPFPLAQNDPAQDALLSAQLLQDELEAMGRLPDPARSVLVTLLARCPKTADAVHLLQPEGRILNGQELLSTIKQEWREHLCPHALPDIVQHAWHDPTAAWALAVVLAWIHEQDGLSVIGKWPREQTPLVAQFLHELRETACDDPGCAWCRAADPVDALRRFFGFDAFRPHQEEIVRAALDGKNVLAVLPTGGGKSLCFQLPALIQAERSKKLTVVFSPLIALMQDQVLNLRQRFEISNCAMLSGALPPLERRDVFDQVRLGTIDLLFLAPEQLRNSSVVELLSSREIARWVVDEAHCISQWGHNFRVDYTYLPAAIRDITGTDVPVSCFTATAKAEVIQEIEQQFAVCTTHPFQKLAPEEQRTNLSYHIRELAEDAKKPELLHLLQEREGNAIIYVRTRMRAEEFATFLQENGIEADFYHAGLDAETRLLRQQAFQDGQIRAMVATTAFGMGIDKKDIRTVILADVPDSLEAYVQEIGRAGRDGLPSETLAIYSEHDISAIYNMLLASQISRRDLVGIFSSLRNRAREAESTHLELTSGEIIEGSDEELSYDMHDRDYDTRTKVALHFLEMQHAAERGLNRARAVPLRLLMDRKHAMQSLEDLACMTKTTRTIAAYLFDRLEPTSADNVTEGVINTDVLLTMLGIDRQTVWNTMETMRQLHILEYDMQIRLKVRTKKTGDILPELEQLTVQMQALYTILCSDARHPADGSVPGVMVIADGDTIVPRVEQASGTRITEQSRLYELLMGLVCVRILKFRKQRNGVFAVTLAAPEGDHTDQPYPPDRLTALCQGTYALMQEFSTLSRQSTDHTVTADAAELIERLQLKEDGPSILDAGVRLLSLERFITLLEVPGLFSPVMSLEVVVSRNPITIHGRDLKAMQDEQYFKVRAVEQYCLQALSRRPGLSTLFGNAQQSYLRDYFELTEKEFVKAHLADVEPIVRKPITCQRAETAASALESLSPEQKAVLDSKQDAIMVVAGPGSGKTRLLVAKVVSLITEERANPATILVLVYNRAACREIQRRLLDTLGDTARAVRVCTFHSFALSEVCHIDITTLLRGDRQEKGFEDAIKAAADILEHHAETERLALPYRYVLIDEYQDITPDQYRMVSALVGRLRESGERQFIFAIGDDDQNIYAYNGADVRYIRQFEQDYDAVRYSLSVNYRSAPELVTFANRLIEQNQDRMKRDLTLRAWGQQPVSGHSIHWTAFASRAQESAMILGLLDDSSRGQSTAILGRTAGDIAHIRWTLHSRGIPWSDLNQRHYSYLPLSLWLFRNVLAGEPNHLYSTSELRATCDRIRREQGLNTWQMQEAEAWLEDIAPAGDQLTGQDLLHDLIQWNFEPSTASTRRYDQQGQEPRLFVDTMHKSKGTEFDNVILVASAGRLELTEDERRVWYVACTRARSSLTLFVPSCEQPLFGSILIPPFAYRLPEQKLAVPPSSLPAAVWSYDLTPKDTYLSFCHQAPEDRNVPAILRGLDAAQLKVIHDRDRYLLSNGTVRLTCSSRAGTDQAAAWHHDPTRMTVESPRTYVRETADEEDFITLATLTDCS